MSMTMDDSIKRWTAKRKTALVMETYDIHPIMISGWKPTAIENMASAFGAQATAEPSILAADVEKLHAKIGLLVVERDFLSEVSGLIPVTGGKRR